MTRPDVADPYADNVLIKGLGPILSREQALKRLHHLPALPGEITSVPKHIRLHMLMVVRDLYLPSLESVRVLQTTDLVIRQGYRYRDPEQAQTWSTISNSPLAPMRPRAPAMAAVVVGHSGVGKTVAIQKAFDSYGQQVIVHEKFPRMAGPHFQMVHLSVDVPASGTLTDLASSLMLAWDDAVTQALPDHPRRFTQSLSNTRRTGGHMMNEWRHVASLHFLGGIHLDEVQNFFKLPTIKARRNAKSIRDGQVDHSARELSIIEDQALKSVLTLSNIWQIPLIASGTPDGVSALMKRLSNAQRFVASGYHKMSEFQSASDPFFIAFMDQLGKYQYVARPTAVDDALRALIFSLTAGLQRLVVALWIAAHRVAFERKEDSLKLVDFQTAGSTYLAPVAAAVAALLSKDPIRMSHYEDLMPRDDSFWVTFWSDVVSN